MVIEVKRILSLLVLCLILVGCGNRTYKEISFSDYEKMMNNKESFILFVGAESCSHCSQYKITLSQILRDYDVEINYIDIDKLSDSEKGKLKSKVTFSGTPTTFFIKDGVASSNRKITGAKGYDDIETALIKYGYID